MNEKPCKPDHNGECLICDCWLSQCAFDRLNNGDFTLETLDQLLEMFKGFLTPEKVQELRGKYNMNYREKIVHFIDDIVEKAAQTPDDIPKVYRDFFLLALTSMSHNVMMDILNSIAKNYNAQLPEGIAEGKDKEFIAMLEVAMEKSKHQT